MSSQQTDNVKTLIMNINGINQEVDIYSADGFRVLSDLWLKSGWKQKYSYRLNWLGIPIIQLPEDILMMQELIYQVKPDVIIETGTAHGGTAVFFASMLQLLGKGRVISIDIEIRPHNRAAVEAHFLSSRITLIERGSVDEYVFTQLRQLIEPEETVLVVLDSNHTYAHVAAEMAGYSQFVTRDSYLVVFDGVMETLANVPDGHSEWVTDNPLTAIREFLAEHPEFQPDEHYNRLGVTYCPSGFLRRTH